MNFFWICNRFFTFLVFVLAVGFFKDVNAIHFERNQPFNQKPQTGDHILYRNYYGQGNVSGRLVETPEAFKNIVRALGSVDFSAVGFVFTERTFISLSKTEMWSERTYTFSTPKSLMTFKEVPKSERAEGVSNDTWTKSVFDRNGTLTNLIAHEDGGVFHELQDYNGWVFHELQDYRGQVIELADFKETDEIYFLNVPRMQLFPGSSVTPITMKVTGIKDTEHFDHLDLFDISYPFFDHRLFQEGVAINSEGKVVGFLVWGNYERRMYLIKVTPKLRNTFLQNTAEARHSSEYLSQNNDFSGCLHIFETKELD